MGFSAARSPFASTSDDFVSSSEQESLESSPTSAQMSPADSTDQAHDSSKDTEGSLASDLDPASGPQRSRSASHSSVAGPSETREKRKRSRVTPEQLAHLERLFAVDRSPTAARRKEISEMLGMQERQTQIWFQNRCVISIRTMSRPPLLKNRSAAIDGPKPSCKKAARSTLRVTFLLS